MNRRSFTAAIAAAVAVPLSWFKSAAATDGVTRRNCRVFHRFTPQGLEQIQMDQAKPGDRLCVMDWNEHGNISYMEIYDVEDVTTAPDGGWAAVCSPPLPDGPYTDPRRDTVEINCCDVPELRPETEKRARPYIFKATLEGLVPVGFEGVSEDDQLLAITRSPGSDKLGTVQLFKATHVTAEGFRVGEWGWRGKSPKCYSTDLPPDDYVCLYVARGDIPRMFHHTYRDEEET